MSIVMWPYTTNDNILERPKVEDVAFHLSNETNQQEDKHNTRSEEDYNADDLVIVAEHREELQVAPEEWNDMFKKHDLKMNLDKTEVMWVGKQREELNTRLEDKDIKQVKNIVYLGGHISENGRVDVEVRRRIQAGAIAWRNVEG